jgi:hypothetical protein
LLAQNNAFVHLYLKDKMGYSLPLKNKLPTGAQTFGTVTEDWLGHAYRARMVYELART